MWRGHEATFGLIWKYFFIRANISPTFKHLFALFWDKMLHFIHQIAAISIFLLFSARKVVHNGLTRAFFYLVC